MKKFYSLILALITISAMGQTTFYTESFESLTGYSFPDSSGVGSSTQDFFGRTDSANAPAEEVFQYTGFDGTYFIAGEDINGVLSGSKGSVFIDNVDISAHSNLEFTAAFASGTDIDIDESTDSMWVEVKIDNGNWVTIGRFRADSATTSSTGFNGQFAEDTNGDGYGDGTRLTGTFTDFTWSIVGSGDSLDIRISMELQSGDEEAAFDYVRIAGTPLTTSINEIVTSESNITVYPNPSSGQLFIKSEKEKIQTIELYDLSGKIVRSLQTPKQLEVIEVNDLPPNLYLLRILTTEGVKTSKVLVQ